MVSRINKLVQKLEEEHEMKRRSEFNLLQYQINPHFLYNTLDTINWMAIGSGNKDISRIVTKLASFFRLGLSNGNEEVSVRNELNHVECFLSINKIRYNNSFDYRITVDPNIAEVKICKMLLQPIVENTLKYGINKNKCGGEILVSATQINERDIELCVQDNGRGMSDEAIECLLDHINQEKVEYEQDGGFGLYNVNRRLKLYYLDKYSFTVENRVEGGLKTTIRINE